MKKIISFAAFLVILTVVGCGKEDKTPETKVEVPPTVLLKQPPTEVTSLVKALGKVKPEEDITIMGMVGGSPNPFAKKTAFITITSKIGKKACCKSQACNKSKPLNAGVQFFDKDGKKIKASMEGFNGLKAGDNVIIKGKVNSATTATNLQIDATGIYIGK